MYDKRGFNIYQLEELEEGIKDGLDCSKFWNKRFDNFQMHQIRMGMKEGFDVDIYAKKYFNAGQMREIRSGMISGIDFRVYASPEFNEYEMFTKREELETEMSKMRFLGKMNMFEGNNYNELVVLANLDMSNYSEYDRAKIRAVIPLLTGGMFVRAEQFLNSEKPASQIEYEVSKIATFLKTSEYNLIDEEALKKTYPNGYEFVKANKNGKPDKGDIKVAYIVENFGKVSKDFSFLKSLISAGVCGYDLGFVTREGFDPKLFTVVVDLIDSDKDYEFIFDTDYSYGQKFEMYKAVLQGIPLNQFNPQMSVPEMMNLRMKIK